MSLQGAATHTTTKDASGGAAFVAASGGALSAEMTKLGGALADLFGHAVVDVSVQKSGGGAPALAALGLKALDAALAGGSAFGGSGGGSVAQPALFEKDGGASTAQAAGGSIALLTLRDGGASFGVVGGGEGVLVIVPAYVDLKLPLRLSLIDQQAALLLLDRHARLGTRMVSAVAVTPDSAYDVRVADDRATLDLINNATYVYVIEQES